MSPKGTRLLRTDGHDDIVGPEGVPRGRGRQRPPADGDGDGDDRPVAREGLAQLLREKVLDLGFESPSAFADVIIRVGPDEGGQFVTFYVNSLVMGLKSRKFERQFYGPLREREFTVNESAEVFRKVLAFIYEEDGARPRLPDFDTEAEDFVQLWFLSDLYEISSLETLVVDAAISAVTKDNVLAMCQDMVGPTGAVGLLPGADRVLFKCLQVLDTCASDVLASTAFTQLDQEMAVDTLKRRSLAASEKEIFNAALRWCRAELQRQRFKAASLVELFAPFRPHIIFEEFNSYEFVHDVMGAGILDADSTREIAENIRQREDRDKFWKDPTRTTLRAQLWFGYSYPPDILVGPNLQYYQAMRYEPEEDMVSSSARPKQYIIEFCCDRDVFIVGAGMTETDEANYPSPLSFDLALNVPPRGDVVARVEHREPYHYPNRMRLGQPKGLECGPNVVLLDKAVRANKHVWHRLTVTFLESSPKLPVLFCRCKYTVKAAGVMFHFRRVGENFAGLAAAQFSPYELITRLLFYY